MQTCPKIRLYRFFSEELLGVHLSVTIVYMLDETTLEHMYGDIFTLSRCSLPSFVCRKEERSV